jgi:hypothetical protein
MSVTTTPNTNIPTRTGVVRNRENDDDDHDHDDETMNPNIHASTATTTTTTRSITTTTTESNIHLTGLLPRPESDSHKKLRRTSNNTTAEEGKCVFSFRHRHTFRTLFHFFAVDTLYIYIYH